MNKTLKLILVKKGIKNFDLAKHLNCDPAKISKIINGWLEPDAVTKQKIADYLKVDENEIWQ